MLPCTVRNLCKAYGLPCTIRNIYKLYRLLPCTIRNMCLNVLSKCVRVPVPVVWKSSIVRVAQETHLLVNDRLRPMIIKASAIKAMIIIMLIMIMIIMIIIMLIMIIIMIIKYIYIYTYIYNEI